MNNSRYSVFSFITYISQQLRDRILTLRIHGERGAESPADPAEFGGLRRQAEQVRGNEGLDRLHGSGICAGELSGRDE